MLVVIVLLLVLTPIPFLGKQKVDVFEETVWAGLGYNYFTRASNLHFFLINAVICFALTVVYLMSSSNFQYSASTRLNNILSYSLSPLYSIKSYMKTNPIGRANQALSSASSS